MPDLVTHTLAAHLGSRAAGARRSTLALVVLGATLPDALARVPVKIVGMIYFRTGHLSDPSYYLFWGPLHFPFGILLWCYAGAHLFAEAQRPRVFGALLAGAASHLALDLLQWHYGGGMPILWPLSWARIELGWFSPEASVVAVPALVLASAAVEILHRRRRAS